MTYCTILLLGLFFIPAFVQAQVVISEIMYDHSGSDTGHEWIELYNESDAPVVMTAGIHGWKLNDGSNHNLVDPSDGIGRGSLTIAPQTYLILSNDPEIFLTEYPSGSYSVIKSAFSLNNTGATITLFDDTGATVDSNAYNKDMGGSGDGNSLHRSGATITPGTPSPGAEESEVQSENTNTNNNTAATSEENIFADQGATNGSISFPTEPQIFANAGKDRTVIVGADSVFEGKAFGLKNEPLENARYIWNFGNGVVKEGQKVLAHYEYPGEYVVTLSVASGKYSASDRLVVSAVVANMIISQADSTLIELSNKTNRDIDLSFWQFGVGAERFMFPEGTIILANRKLIFASSVTKLVNARPDSTILLYPNGAVAAATAPTPLPALTLPSSPSAPKTQSKSPKAGISITPQVALASAEAAPSIGQKGGGQGILPWLGALGAVIIAGVGVIVFWKREDADEIKILE